MNQEEKRSSARSGITLENHHNLFFLERDGAKHAITKIRNVSISGVGIDINQAIPASEAVALTYDSDDFTLTINGITVWCSPITEDDGDGYALGIQFDATDPSDNSLFFLAVRKFLDDFDGGTFDS